MLTGPHAPKFHKYVHKMVEPWDAPQPEPATGDADGAKPATEGGGGGELAASSRGGSTAEADGTEPQNEPAKTPWSEASALWPSDGVE